MTATLTNVVTPTSPLASQIATTTTNAPVSKKVLIIWQKSTISKACKQAMATIEGGVHIWDPVIDGQKLDGSAFEAASYDCLILWAGNTKQKNAAEEVHNWVTKNRAFIKANGIKSYVIPTKIFSLAGIESVYEDFAISLKSLPKWSDNLGNLLVKMENKFPESEVSLLSGLFSKLLTLFSKNE